MKRDRIVKDDIRQAEVTMASPLHIVDIGSTLYLLQRPIFSVYSVISLCKGGAQ